LKILNGSRDIVQLFSHAVDMNTAKEAIRTVLIIGIMALLGQ